MQRAWSVRMADAAIAKWPACDVSGKGSPRWIYEEGTLLEGVDDVWHATSDPKYYNYIKSCVDAQVDKDGHIATYNASQYALDDVLMGRMALLMYNVTLDKRYYLAAKAMRAQLATQPRTPSGGFWHKQRYPNQMWLDGLYMAEPFYAEYARVFQEPKDFDDIALQFELSEKHLRDPKTGLLYHGWDESEDAEVGGPGQRALAGVLVARHGLVHDGAGRCAGLLSRRPSAARRAGCDPEPACQRSCCAAGCEDRPVV